jgi:anti-sigma B factor antagonist
VTHAAEPSGWRANPLAAEPVSAAAEATAAVGGRPASSLALDTPQRPWGLSAQHYPALGICIVVVEGELDLLTAPLLEQRVREQLLAVPTHLILDLESVHFLDSSGLRCLLQVRKLAQTTGTRLHLTGLITRAVVRAVETTGLRGVFSTYPTLIHAVVELANRPDARADTVVPAPVRTAFWRHLMGSVWILELCEFDAGTGIGAVVDWINSGVPATQPAPDMAQELLAVHGLWLFRDPFTGSPIGSRRRIGYACTDAELIMLADRMRDVADQAGLHPVMLAAWVAAGYSTNTAAGWIRAGCLFPR